MSWHSCGKRDPDLKGPACPRVERYLPPSWSRLTSDWFFRSAALTLAICLFSVSPPASAQEAQVGQVVVKLPASESGWFLEGKPVFSDGIIALNSTDIKRVAVISKSAVGNAPFSLTFDFLISSADTTGQHNGMHVAWRYPTKPNPWSEPDYYWDLDLANPRLVMNVRRDGRRHPVPLLHYDLAQDKWYRCSIEGSEKSVTVTVWDANGRMLLLPRKLKHDAGLAVAQPVSFWADSDLFGTRHIGRAPVQSVFAPYYQYRKTNEWSPYIKVGGRLRNISLSTKSTPVASAGRTKTLIANQYLALSAAEDGSVFLVDRRGAQKLVELPGRPARLAQVVGSAEAPIWKAQSIRVHSAIGEVSQIWRSGKLPVQLTLTYRLRPGEPFVRVRTSARSLDNTARKIDILFSPLATSDFPYSARAFAFPWTTFDWKRYFESGSFDFDVDLENQPIQLRWGISELSWGDGPGINIFNPVIALLRPSSPERLARDSIVLTWDNRDSIGIRADNAGWSVARRLYLPATGQPDDGFDLQDGDGEIPHELVIGYCRDTGWEQLVFDYYLSAYPLYRMDSPNLSKLMLPGLQGSQENFFTQDPWTQEKARKQALEGARYITLFYGHANLPRYAKEFGFNRTGCEIARSYGMVVGMSDNIALAPQPMKITDPAQNYVRFTDSWVYNADGAGPFINWEGVMVNQSPRFSFGRYELRNHQDLITRYGLGLDYMDLYYCWGTDYGHSYQGYGFYPYIVGINEWMRQKSAWLRDRNVPYVLNAPHRQSSLVRFADVVQGDIGDIEFFPVFHKIQSGTRLLRTYGAPTEAAYDPSNSRFEGKAGAVRKALEFSLFNGLARQALPGEDVTGEERDHALALSNRNIALGFAVGRSRLVAGHPFRQYDYASDDGDLFVTVRSPGMTTSTVPISFSRRLPVDPHARYAVFVWDVDSGAHLYESPVTGLALSHLTVPVTLEAQQAKVVIALPLGKQVVRYYLGYDPASGVYTASSTGLVTRVSSLQGETDIEIAAIPDRVTTTVVSLPEGVSHNSVSVRGARSASVNAGPDGCAEVTITHSEQPAVIVVSGKRS